MRGRGTLARALVFVLALAMGGGALADDAGVAVDGSVGDGPPVRVVRVRDLLVRAIQHYQRSEFDQARPLLKEILGYVGKERSRTAQEAHTYDAFVLVAYGETGEAVNAFERALAINPELTLAAPAPRIASVFQQARRRFRAKVRALDHDPPRLAHSPPGTSSHGKPVVVTVEAHDVSGVKRVVLNFRIAGNRGFSSVKLERGESNRYVATIPTISVMRPGVEYFIEAWDALGNGPGLKGSANKPIMIRVKGGPAASAEPESVPWYKRWWVWAVASGVVVVAGSAAVGAYLNREETARVNVQVPSTLNPPGGK